MENNYKIIFLSLTLGLIVIQGFVMTGIYNDLQLLNNKIDEMSMMTIRIEDASKRIESKMKELK
jgi:hypothetical protein